MPHVVLEGNVNIEEFFNSFKKVFFRSSDGSIIVRLDEILVNSLKTRLLIKATSVDNGVSRSYYISILVKDSSVTVRLDELTDPDKSHGVKMSLALVAKMLIAKNGMNIARTNIGEYLDKVIYDQTS